jgi:hypothetical protein
MGASFRRLLALFRRDRLERDLEDEVAFHLAMRGEERVQQGLPANQAIRASRREFGNVLRVKEQSGDAWLFCWLESVLQDVRFATRTLRKSPGFTAAAALTLGLGIGATTILFSIAYGVLMKPLPWADADRLVRVTETRGGRVGRVRGTLMNSTFVAWADRPSTIDGLAGWLRPQPMTITVRGTTEPLARSVSRGQEIAIRAALGAGALRLTRQLLGENAVLGAVGGAIGFALAIALHRILPVVLPADFPRLDNVSIGTPIVLFAAAVSISTSILCGIVPAVYVRRLPLVEPMSEGRSSRHGSLRTSRARMLIVAGQVALASALLVGATLLTRSFLALLHADRGFDSSNVLTARLPVPPSYSADRRIELVDALRDRLRVLPGVTHAAISNALPFLSEGGFSAFKMPSPGDPAVQLDVEAAQRVVTPEYFTALRLRIVAGRPLTPADAATAQPLIVVNRTFAPSYLGSEPVGARIPAPKGGAGFRFRDSQADWEVVGVVEDMRQDSINAPRQPEIFAAFPQIAARSLGRFDPILVLRTVSDPVDSVGPVRVVVRDVAPTLALDSVMTMQERVSTSLARPRTYALLLSGFALSAVSITGIGLFALLSYFIAQRFRELPSERPLGPSGMISWRWC